MEAPEAIFTDRRQFDFASVRVGPIIGHLILRPVIRNRDGRLARRLRMTSIHSIAIR
jgi:hypothetical protein